MPVDEVPYVSQYWHPQKRKRIYDRWNIFWHLVKNDKSEAAGTVLKQIETIRDTAERHAITPAPTFRWQPNPKQSRQ